MFLEFFQILIRRFRSYSTALKCLEFIKDHFAVCIFHVKLKTWHVGMCLLLG
jgi:hypothetical protein